MIKLSKNQIKKTTDRIVSELDENVCVNKITKSHYE